MTLEQLEIFLEIAGGKTYLTIAEEMNMSQSSVSRSMRALEEEMGVLLLKRDGRSIALTQAGQVFSQDLQEIMPKMHQTLKHVKSYATQRTIGCAIVPKTPFLRMNRVTDAFQRLMPDCVVQKVELSKVQDAWDMLSKYQVDFIIMHRPNYVDAKAYNAHEFLEDQLMLALPSDHPLAAAQSIKPESIRDETLLLNENSFYEMMQVSERCGVHFKADYQPLTRIDLLMQVIERKHVGVVWKTETKLFQFSSLRFVPLEIDPIPFVLIARNQEMTSYQRKFMDCFLLEAPKLNMF